jgi:hypothetical protein
MPAALQAEQEAEQRTEPVGRMARALRQQANFVDERRAEVVKLKRGHRSVSEWLQQRASMDPQALRDYADRLEAGTLAIDLGELEVTVTYWAHLMDGETRVACVSGELNLEGSHLECLGDQDLDALREPESVPEGVPDGEDWGACDGSLPFDGLSLDYAGEPRWFDAR